MLEIFYDRLAPYYKFIYQDWEASVKRQASTLDDVIHEHFGNNVHTILDAACGIGTQSIGLAQLGYEVTASDISSGEIERARAEASKRNLDITFHVADMRRLLETFHAKFDVVIACDNAIPHLLSDADIHQAFEQFYQITTENGGCIISVRDYAAMECGGRKLHPRQVHDTPDGKIVIFDLWEFDGDFYDMTIYVVEDKGQAVARTEVIHGGRYYCVFITKLEKLLRDVGFKQVVTLKDSFFQPMLVGIKAST